MAIPSEYEHLEPIMVRNPATNQILQTTKKVFESIYVDKGFEILSRDNVANGAVSSGRRSGEKRKKEPASVTGSAAAIAAGLGLDETAGAGSMTFDQAAAKYKEIEAAGNGSTPPADNAGTGAVEGAKDENAVNSNSATVTAEREPVKRDRGRNT